MATISEVEFLEKLAENGETSRPEYSDIREWVLERMPEKAEAEGNKHVDQYIPIKLQQVRRNIKKETGIEVTKELTPFLFPKGMPAGSGRSRADKKEVYGGFLSKLGIEVETENDEEDENEEN